jgi:hypothetical protein
VCGFEAKCSTQNNLHGARYCVRGYRVSGVGVGGEAERGDDDDM